MNWLDRLRGRSEIEDEAARSRAEIEKLRVALMLKQRRAEALRREVLKVEKLPR